MKRQAFGDDSRKKLAIPRTLPSEHEKTEENMNYLQIVLSSIFAVIVLFSVVKTHRCKADFSNEYV